MRRAVHVALIHWPVKDRAGNIVCTNVTNFDIHDIARASRTYGVERYFIVNRMQEQLMFVSRVIDHWKTGTGSKYNPSRKSALGMVDVKETLADVLTTFKTKPLVVSTSARDRGIPRVSFKAMREEIWDPAKAEAPVLLVFGTGFGLEDSIFASCDLLLEPIKGASADDYRHLSVRSAVSICLDRLLST